jgi:hypothetical protein
MVKINVYQSTCADFHPEHCLLCNMHSCSKGSAFVPLDTNKYKSTGPIFFIGDEIQFFRCGLMRLFLLSLIDVGYRSDILVLDQGSSLGFFRFNLPIRQE